MGSDDILVLEYLKQFAQAFTDVTQISKTASGKARYAREPEWALPALRRLETGGHLETDELGQYRIAPALLAKYIEHYRGGQHLDRGCQAVTKRIIKMVPADDEKTFNDLIREALSSNCANE